MIGFDVIAQVTKLMSHPERLGTMVEPVVQDFLNTFETTSADSQCGCLIMARPADSRICVSIVEMNSKGSVIDVKEIMLLEDFIKKIMKIYKNGNK